MVIVCFSYILCIDVAFKLKYNGKVNPKSFIDLPDRDSTYIFNSNKASSRYFDRNRNYLTTIPHACYVVCLQPCFRDNFAKASDLTNKYLSDLAEQHKTASEIVLSQ